jgi:hypothetical protein
VRGGWRPGGRGWDVVAYRWLGQETTDVCRRPGCFAPSIPNLGAHLHLATGFSLVKYGNWVCKSVGEDGRPGDRAWTADDLTFVDSYRIKP